MPGGTLTIVMLAILALSVRPLAVQGEEGGGRLAGDNTVADFVARQLAAGRKANRLLNEKSPYLLQHAFNPVQWQPWGEEAFSQARRENKPIFLSIGYSTCHWCHVMAHESFEDPALAAILNRDFVPIKVDREERPDLDRIYMTVTQAMTGSGGWPMSVFLTPELTPFFAGGYFPPQAAYGRPGFGDLLERISTAWRLDRANIVRQAAAIVQALAASGTGLRAGSEGQGLSDGTAALAAEQLTRGYDRQYGGFGVAPKFPRPAGLSFLLRYGQRLGDQAILDMVTTTLRRMAGGGLCDQVGGGFHRYSVDALWRVPHFEKMLYDQAQLAVLYLEAAQLTQDPEFGAVAARTLDYTLAVMRDASGGFYAAEDADSPEPDDPSRQGEGAYYLWREEELRRLLGPQEAAVFCFRFGVQAAGNAPSDPQGEFRGRNILYQANTLAATARRFELTEAETNTILTRALEKLRAARSKRPPPHCDDKLLASWNGLMISALAKAGSALQSDRYLAAAEQAAAFVRDRLLASEGHRLWHRYRAGEAGIVGQLDDYVLVVQGLLDLYEASFDWQWLTLALELTRSQIIQFADDKEGGFFETSGQDRSIILRLKGDYDGAEPAANSVAALNLLRLGRMLNDRELLALADRTLAAFAPRLAAAPGALPQMLAAYEYQRRKPVQIVLAGRRGAADMRRMQQAVAELFLPNKLMLLAEDVPPPALLAAKLAPLAYMRPQGGKATAYVCEDFACRQPTTDPQVLRQMLAK